MIAYPIDVKEAPEVITKVLTTYNLKDVIITNRKWMTYLVETLDFLASKLDRDEKYVNICYLVYKILVCAQKNLARSSPYW